MSEDDVSSLSLAPHTYKSVQVLHYCGGAWIWPWKSCVYEKWRQPIFFTYLLMVLTYLAVGCCYVYFFSLNSKEVRSRHLAMAAAILNTNLQILVLFTKRHSLGRLLHLQPPFANKRAIEAQLQHALRIIRPWALFKVFAYLVIFLGSLVSILDTTVTDFPSASGVDYLAITFRVLRIYSLLDMAIYQFGISMFIMTLLAFINGYLNHLKVSIRRLRIRDPLLINVDWIEDYAAVNEYDVQYVVSLHQFIIRLVDITNSIFSWVLQLIIWQALTSLITGIRLFLSKDPTATRVISYAIIYLLEMLCYCYLADDINRKSGNLSTVCLQKLCAAQDMIIGDWKSLQVMAQRCQTMPMVIQGGPFYVLNLRTFIALFAVSLTLISVS